MKKGLHASMVALRAAPSQGLVAVRPNPLDPATQFSIGSRSYMGQRMPVARFFNAY
ncbi:hypothetical protein ABIB27_003365 [Arthrobacter sp. UYEF21]